MLQNLNKNYSLIALLSLGLSVGYTSATQPVSTEPEEQVVKESPQEVISKLEAIKNRLKPLIAKLNQKATAAKDAIVAGAQNALETTEIADFGEGIGEIAVDVKDDIQGALASAGNALQTVGDKISNAADKVEAFVEEKSAKVAEKSQEVGQKMGNAIKKAYDRVFN